MTDIGTDDPLDNSAAIPPSEEVSEGLSEDLSGNASPTDEKNALTPNQETENMEVHHHPDLHHKRKNFSLNIVWLSWKKKQF